MLIGSLGGEDDKGLPSSAVSKRQPPSATLSRPEARRTASAPHRNCGLLRCFPGNIIAFRLGWLSCGDNATPSLVWTTLGYFRCSVDKCVLRPWSLASLPRLGRRRIPGSRLTSTRGYWLQGSSLEGSLFQLFVRTCVLVPTPDLDDNHQASPASVHLGTFTLVSESRYPLAVLATLMSAFATSSSFTTFSFVLCLRSRLRALIFRLLVVPVLRPPIPLKRLWPYLPYTTSSAYSATACLDLNPRTSQRRCAAPSLIEYYWRLHLFSESVHALCPLCQLYLPS